MTINIDEKLAQFTEHWQPKIIAELNDDKVQVVRLKGEFIWHSHAVEDELFYVIRGVLLIHFRDRTETLRAGEMIVIPHGVEHKPEAPEEAHILLIEPKTTLNTGDAASGPRTARAERI